jgi:hypothetical protein
VVRRSGSTIYRLFHAVNFDWGSDRILDSAVLNFGFGGHWEGNSAAAAAVASHCEIGIS